MTRKHIVVALTLILVWSSILFGIERGMSQVSEQDTEATLKRVNLLKDVFMTIQTDYVDADQVDPNALVEAAITRMVKSVDPRGQYYTAEQVEQMGGLDDSLTAETGIILDSTDSQVRIVAALQDTAPWKAGVLPGDLVTRINDQLLYEITFYDVYALFKGDKGATLDLETWREWQDPQTRKKEKLTLTRGVTFPTPVSSRVISLPSGVEGKPDFKFGYIRITRTEPTTGSTVAQAVASLMGEGARDGFVIDVRSCAYGKNLDGVSIADNFVTKGDIICHLRDRLKDTTQEFRAERGATSDAPVVVLVDEGTAGPAEIIAGALQDLARGVVIGPRGTRTAAHCVETSLVRLEHGGALRLSTEEYLTPGKKPIQSGGIVPDTSIDVSRQNRRDMIAGGYFGVTRDEAKAKAEAAAATDETPEAPVDPAVPDPVDVEDVFSDEEPIDIFALESKKYDVQLQRGIELLTSARIFARAHALETE